MKILSILLCLVMCCYANISRSEEMPEPNPILVVNVTPLQSYPEKMRELAQAYLQKRITYFQYLQLKNELQWEMWQLMHWGLSNSRTY